MNQYEAMFLFDPTFGNALENCEAEIHRLLERAEAQIVFLRKWDERRLAYRVKGRKRGVYVLVYFKAKADKIAPLERDAQLAENILRLLVLRADDVTLELMEKGTPLRAATADERGRSDAPKALGKVESEKQIESDKSDAPVDVGPQPVATETLASDAPGATDDDKRAAEIS